MPGIGKKAKQSTCLRAWFFSQHNYYHVCITHRAQHAAPLRGFTHRVVLKSKARALQGATSQDQTPPSTTDAKTARFSFLKRAVFKIKDQRPPCEAEA